jgi:hypothetical protein
MGAPMRIGVTPLTMFFVSFFLFDTSFKCVEGITRDKIQISGHSCSDFFIINGLRIA